MKTKELIKQLQKVDPSGESECVIDGCDILYMDRLPGYYNGSYEILVRDENGTITEAIETTKGYKVQIRPYSIWEAIFDCPSIKATADFEEGEEGPRTKRFNKHIEKTKKQRLEMDRSSLHNAVDEFENSYKEFLSSIENNYLSIKDEPCGSIFEKLKKDIQWESAKGQHFFAFLVKKLKFSDDGSDEQDCLLELMSCKKGSPQNLDVETFLKWAEKQGYSPCSSCRVGKCSNECRYWERHRHWRFLV